MAATDAQTMAVVDVPLPPERRLPGAPGVAQGIFLGIVHLAFVSLAGISGSPDSEVYRELARTFPAYLWGDHVQRTPGYPFFLWLTGTSPQAAVLLQHAMVIAMAYLAHALLRPHSRAVAGSAFWLIGLHPFLALWSSYILTETLASVLLLGVVRAVGTRRPLLAGVLIGLATLVRPICLVALPAAVITRGLRRERRETAQMIAACILVLAPWVARNAVNANYPGLSAFSGFNLYIRYSHLMDPPPAAPYQAGDRILQDFGQVAGDRACLQIAVETALRKPQEALLVIPRSAKGFLGYDLGYLIPSLYREWSEPLARNTPPVVIAKVLFQVLIPLVILLLAAAGVRAGWTDPALRAAFWIFMGFWSYTALFAFGESRFRAPVEALLVILAALGWSRASEWFGARRHLRRGAGGDQQLGPARG